MNVPDFFESARTRLQIIPREGLGALVLPRRILGIPRPLRIEPRGWVWHLGVLLLSDDDVMSTGQIIRARTEARRGYAAESQRERAELAAAAIRGGFAEGQTVHVGWQILDLEAIARGEASGPLALRGGVPHVRWSAVGGWMPLAAYLDERISLLEHPPLGAS